MKIIFIRHGEAEIFADDDFERKLTIAGRQKLEATFEEFAEDLEDKENYVIYSSPLRRAKETAEILSRHLEKDFEVKNFLAGGRIEDIIETLEREKNYIFVSHEPFISNWIYQLTGEVKIVSRGSIHPVEVK